MSSMCLIRGASRMVAIMPTLPPITDLPDSLVLGAGGTLGEAWMRGLLTGLESTSGLDFRGCEYVLGTSAGSIVAATLASGHRLDAGDRAAREWGEATRDAPERRGIARTALRAGAVLASPLAPLAFAGLEPAGRLARSAALAAAPRPGRTLAGLGRHVDTLHATFDGRLRTATVTDAVLASCAVPWLFAPVVIDGCDYVDGGVWSPVNLDAAPGGRGARVLCLAPTAGAGPLKAITHTAVGAEQ